MKQFFKMTLAVILGILLSVFVLIVVFSSMMAALMTFDTHSPVPSKAVLDIDLSRVSISEQIVPTAPLQNLGSGDEMPVSLGLWDVITSIEKASQDPRISYILLRPDAAMTMDPCVAEELRNALEEFRANGKAVLSYIENPSSLSYYIASVADKVYMTSHTGSMITLVGVNSSMIYIKDLLDKLGVNVQLIRHGKYKSAGEPFIKSTPSAEALEQTRSMVKSMWASIATKIAASRDISVEKLNSLIDNLELYSPEQMLSASLVDGLLSGAQLCDKIADIAMEDSYSKVNFVSLADYVADCQLSVSTKSSAKIAVVYANGQIVDGRSTQEVAGDRFASIIRKVREDESIKAVVLRVNSPGGSVLASEKIKAELDSIVGKKPLIASYGAYAASGGYWISANCDKVYTDELTLTGSIGVFSMVPDFSKTLKSVAHVNVVTVSSNKHGDMYSLMRPFDQAELRYMQEPIEQVYDKFVTVVSEGRDISREYVDAVGQGRVWTGAEALGLGLVDEIGGLRDAINYAANLIEYPTYSDCEIVSYPKPQTMLESLMSVFGQSTDMESVMISKLRDLKEVKMVARIPYEIEFSW